MCHFAAAQRSDFHDVIISRISLSYCMCAEVCVCVVLAWEWISYQRFAFLASLDIVTYVSCFLCFPGPGRSLFLRQIVQITISRNESFSLLRYIILLLVKQHFLHFSDRKIKAQNSKKASEVLPHLQGHNNSITHHPPLHMEEITHRELQTLLLNNTACVGS